MFSLGRCWKQDNSSYPLMKQEVQTNEFGNLRKGRTTHATRQTHLVISGFIVPVVGIIAYCAVCLTLLCHLRSGGFRWKLTIRFNNLRLPTT